MEIAETEGNVNTPNIHIHDRSLSKLDTLACGIKVVLSGPKPPSEWNDVVMQVFLHGILSCEEQKYI